MSNVDHPSHYNQEGKKECIDEMVDIFGVKNTIMFALLNSYKYMYRDGLKSESKEDKDKARWYIQWSADKIIEYQLQDSDCEKYFDKILNIFLEIYNGDF